MTRRISRRSFSRSLGRTVAAGIGATALGRAAVAVAAAEVEASVSLSSATTRVGEPVRINMVVQVRGGRAPSQIPWPAALRGTFDVGNVSSAGGSSRDLLAGPSAAIYTRKVSAIITPFEAGSFELGFEVEIEGELVKSNVPVLEVLAADAELPAPPPGSDPTEAAGPVFLWATLDKEEVYVGQQVTYSLDVYERRAFLGVHLRKPPSFTDFFTEELDEGETSVKSVGGRDYRVRPGLRRALFPQRAGTLEVGAAELSLGGRQHIQSPPKSVVVKPLPAEGQPAGFLPNNVGRYTISAEVDRNKVPANEPVTLTVAIEGEGNVKFVDPGPWPQLDGIRRYDPKVETRLTRGNAIGGRRQYEFLLIPERGGELTIPAHELSFFDPVEGRYEVVRTEPIVLTIEGDEVSAPEPEPTAEPGTEDIAPLVTGDVLPRHTPRERWLTPQRWLYGMVAVPTIAVAGLGGAAAWRRFGADEQTVSRARRRARHRELVEEAEAAVSEGKGFHASVMKLLQEIAVDRAGTAGVGLPRPELLELLTREGVPAADVERLRDLLDRCDLARFGAQGDTEQDRQALLAQVLDLVQNSALGKGAS